MPLAKSNIETRSRQGEFRFICIRDMPKRSENRDFTQCKELVSPSKRRLENRATSLEEGEDVPGSSSGEDTVRFDEKYGTVHAFADHAQIA